MKTKLLRILNYEFRDYFKFITFISLLISLSSTMLAQQTLRLYFIGNSVTDAINYNGLKALAESRGNTHIWARQMIPGAPLSWLWEHPNDGFNEQPYGYPTNAFPNYTWDAISLQPFDRGITGSDGDATMYNNYVNLSKGKSPNCQYYIYMRWPRTPNSKLPTDPSLTADTWTTEWNKPSTSSNEGIDFFEKLLLETRRFNISNKQPLMVPVGEVFNQLNTKMKNGQVSGYSSIWQVYSDGIHMTGIGAYIAAVTYYSTLYKADPRGLGVPSQYGTISSSLATTIQNTVWEVVSSYQYSGVGTGVPVIGVSLSPTSLSLSVGQTSPITATVAPANATNKGVNWSSSNTSIATVNSSGQVTGQANGTATITATTSDGNKTATTSVTVSAGSGGLSYQFYTGSFSALPNFSGLTPSKTGTVSNFDLTPRTQNDNFAFRFTGSIQIATAGSYTFFTTSDDGSKLYIDGTQVVNNDGLHGMVEASGAITLSASAHTIEVTFFEAGGGEGLEVRYQGPGISKQLIPNSAFSSSGVAVTGVSVSPAPSSVMIGKSTQLTATVAPANATNKLVTWSTSNGAVASVNSSGLVSGIAAGTANITATTSDGNKTSSSTITVFANTKPTAVLNASVTSGNAPLVVNFNANGSSDPNPGDFVLGYEWNFGDGSAQSSANAPSHTYTNVGSYTVTLRVVDDNALYSDPVTRTIVVSSGSGGGSGTLATWDFTGKGGQSSVVASSKAADVTSATASLASGISALNYLSNGLTASEQTGTTLAQALSGNEYISFNITPVSGKSVSITSVEIRPISQDAIRTFAVFSSKNGFTSGNQIATFTSESQFGASLVSTAISNHANLTTATEFRIYVYGGGNQYQSIGVGNKAGAAGTYDLAILGTSSSGASTTGTVVRETWTGVSGTAVSQIPFGTAPNSTSNLTSIEIPVNNGDDYGTRIRGYIIPSTSGSYTFYVSGDDDVEFWLSSNNLPANNTKAAFISGWTNSREWNKFASQTSSAKSLTAGQQYYFDLFHKEGGGGDNLALGWTGPGISSITVIGGSNIAPYTGGAREAGDKELDNTITVYPNPANHEVNISGLTNSTVIDLVNLDGKVVMSQISNAASEKLSLANVSAGLYILKVRDSTGTKMFKLSID